MPFRKGWSVNPLFRTLFFPRFLCDERVFPFPLGGTVFSGRSETRATSPFTARGGDGLEAARATEATASRARHVRREAANGEGGELGDGGPDHRDRARAACLGVPAAPPMRARVRGTTLRDARLSRAEAVERSRTSSARTSRISRRRAERVTGPTNAPSRVSLRGGDYLVRRARARVVDRSRPNPNAFVPRRVRVRHLLTRDPPPGCPLCPLPPLTNRRSSASVSARRSPATSPARARGTSRAGICFSSSWRFSRMATGSTSTGCSTGAFPSSTASRTWTRRKSSSGCRSTSPSSRRCPRREGRRARCPSRAPRSSPAGKKRAWTFRPGWRVCAPSSRRAARTRRARRSFCRTTRYRSCRARRNTPRSPSCSSPSGPSTCGACWSASSPTRLPRRRRRACTASCCTTTASTPRAPRRRRRGRCRTRARGGYRIKTDQDGLPASKTRRGAAQARGEASLRGGSPRSGARRRRR